MERANILLVAEHTVISPAIKALQEAGHNVVAFSWGVGLTSILLNAAMREANINVAVVATDLTPGRNDGVEGDQVATLVRNRLHQPALFCWARQGPGSWGDKLVLRTGNATKDMDTLLEAIAELK